MRWFSGLTACRLVLQRNPIRDIMQKTSGICKYPVLLQNLSS